VQARLMDQENPTDDPFGDDAVIFVAEGVLCEQLDVSMNEAVVALAGMAVDAGVGLLEVARGVVAGAFAPESFAQTRQPAKEHARDPDS
jgi:hypothetical protein